MSMAHERHRRSSGSDIAESPDRERRAVSPAKRPRTAALPRGHGAAPSSPASEPAAAAGAPREWFLGSFMPPRAEMEGEPVDDSSGLDRPGETGGSAASSDRGSPEAAPGPAEPSGPAYPAVRLESMLDGEPTDEMAGSPGQDGGRREGLDAGRNRLFATFAHGMGVSDSRAWDALDESARAVFLTVTHRLAGSRLANGDSMLSHITRVYAIHGGGSDGRACGGIDNNRVFFSMDDELYRTLVRVYETRGKEPLITDVAGDVWRESHDKKPVIGWLGVGGPHKPFDMSDETNRGGPRAQAQFFSPRSRSRNQPLGRPGVERVVDPNALEVDMDYNVPHDSNPLCDYDGERGTKKYAREFGDPKLDWTPPGYRK